MPGRRAPCYLSQGQSRISIAEFTADLVSEDAPGTRTDWRDRSLTAVSWSALVRRLFAAAESTRVYVHRIHCMWGCSTSFSKAWKAFSGMKATLQKAGCVMKCPRLSVSSCFSIDRLSRQLTRGIRRSNSGSRHWDTPTQVASVVFTIRDTLLRVISARPMSRRERGIYAKRT